MSKLTEQVDAVEKSLGALDQEVLGAVGSSVRKIIKDNQSKSEATMKDIAFGAVRTSLQPFPKYAADHVRALFNKRMREAYDQGYRRGVDIYSGSGSEEPEKIVTLTDFLS